MAVFPVIRVQPIAIDFGLTLPTFTPLGLKKLREHLPGANAARLKTYAPLGLNRLRAIFMTYS